MLKAMTVYTIREFQPADLRPMLRIEHTAFGIDAWHARDFMELHELPTSVFLVAEAGARIAGYVVGDVVDGTVGYIVTIAVDPVNQGQGLGRALLNVAMQHLGDLGARLIRLHVNVSNYTALRLYHSSGFHSVSVIPRYYADGSTAYLMERPLVLADGAG